MNIKNNKQFRKLLDQPNFLAYLLKYEIGVNIPKKAEEELVRLGYIDSKGNVSIIVKRRSKNVSLKDRELSKIKISEVPEKDKEYFKIALKFRELFIKNGIELRLINTHPEKAKYNWVDDIRLMITNGECSVENLRDAYKFISVTKFWKINVRTVPKLRIKIATIHGQSRSDKKTPRAKEGRRDY